MFLTKTSEQYVVLEAKLCNEKAFGLTFSKGSSSFSPLADERNEPKTAILTDCSFLRGYEKMTFC